MTAPTTAWLAEQYHSGRMNLPTSHHHLLSETEHSSLTNTFTTLTSNLPRLEKATLITHIRSHLPRSLPPTFAETIYQILTYHTSVPLYKPPSPIPPSSISFLETQRGFAWLLPQNHLSMSETGNIGRMRTPADGRRLLFQSLATLSVPLRDSPSKESVRRGYARRNAFDAEHARKYLGFGEEEMEEMLKDWCKCNRDEDGDEMWHDLLDVLHACVPENYPYASTRESLRPLAKKIGRGVVFHEIVVEKERLRGLVRGVLGLQFEEVMVKEMEMLDGPVESVLATFVCEDEELAGAYPNSPYTVAWPAFDQALRHLPYLFDPVHRILIKALLDSEPYNMHTSVKSLYGAPPELLRPKDTGTKPYVLSRSWMNLMPVILPDIVDWESLHTVLRWNSSQDSNSDTTTPPTSDAIWAHMRARDLQQTEEIPLAIILAFDGHDQASGEPFKGGVMVGFDYDGKAGRERLYNLYIFRLLPSVRFLELIDQRWKYMPGNGLAFGNSATTAGFRFLVDDMAIDIDIPAFGRHQSIKLDSLEIWDDSGSL